MSETLVTDSVAGVQTVTHRETWRGEPFTLNYVMLRSEPDAAALLASCRWALGEGLENPRMVTPSILAWSSLFQPTLYAALVEHGDLPPTIPLRFAFSPPGGCGNPAELSLLWLQSVVFLAAVTMSAAIVQGRWSRGTIESKFDRLWQASTSSALPKTVDAQRLRDEVVRLASTPLPSIELLLAIRRQFTILIKALSSNVDAERVTASATMPAEDDRFGFAAWLADWLPGLTGVIVYGSSVSGPDYADIDAILVVDDADLVLRLLENRQLEWGGKELNVGVYTQTELWRIQLLSGDNLADYGHCILGEVELPHKQIPILLARNLSFGIVRQRQQLGMLARALWDESSDGDDRRNLHHYFVKIPANVAKGTFGALGRRLSKSNVHAWLRKHTGFDTEREQRAVLTDGPALPLAASALATMAALREINAELNILEPIMEKAA